jgi:uncharacterized membrane protein
MPLYLVLIYMFAGIGVLDTLYLMYHKVRGTDVACPFFAEESCRKVQYASKSKTLGVPNSFAWLFLYITILALAHLYSTGAIDFFPVQIAIGIGFSLSLYSTYVQAAVLRAFCTWCVVSAISFTMLFVSAFFLR